MKLQPNSAPVPLQPHLLIFTLIAALTFAQAYTCLFLLKTDTVLPTGMSDRAPPWTFDIRIAN
jgi:hypothetical protein